MKNYIIIALPEKEISNAVELFRKNVIGQILVDNLPPHVTFKRRFTLNNEFSEQDLITYFKALRFKKFAVNFVGSEKMNDVIALVGESSEMSVAHGLVIDELGVKITTKNPEWEKDGYKIHMTLLRGLTEEIALPDIKRTVFDKLVLYDIDSSSERLFANEIVSIELD